MLKMDFIGECNVPAKLKNGQSSFSVSENGRYVITTRKIDDDFIQETFLFNSPKIKMWCEGLDVEGDKVQLWSPVRGEMAHLERVEEERYAAEQLNDPYRDKPKTTQNDIYA